MNTISFMTANFVARQIGYHMTAGWMQGEDSTNAYFKPQDTFPARFESYLADARALGFEAVDLWLPLLNPAWATAEHTAAACDILARLGLTVTSLAGGFGRTREEFEACCKLAAALKTTRLGGSSEFLTADRPAAVHLLQDYGLLFGIENHPEKTPDEMLARIGDGGDGTIGTTVDTGWYGTHGYNAAEALRKLAGHIVHVHLKDVLKPGGHETCRYGRGCVPIADCVRVLKQTGYQGPIAMEHEPERFDPSEDCLASLAMLKGWLAS
jgi:sugar phosphate isomerase/epimerase